MGPNLTEINSLRNAQQQQAANFRQNQAGMQADQERADRMRGRSDLTQSMMNVGKNYNSRGLLYSGLNQRDQMGAASQLSGDLAAKKAQTSSNLEQTGREYESQAINSGLLSQSMEQQGEDERYQNALNQRQARVNATGSIFGAGGAVLGGLLGR